MADVPTKSETLSRSHLLILLAICLLGVGAVVFLVFRPADKEPEVVLALVEVETPADTKVNVGTVIDTIEQPDAEVREGGRFKVLIVDEAREGASGIARIGGMVTFVPQVRVGDVVVVEVTRLKRSTADAIVLERLESGVSVPGRAARADARPRQRETAVREVSSALVGQVFQGQVTDTGRDGDGIVRLDGKVVFVTGAKEGERVSFRVTSDEGRFARGEVVEKLAASAPDPDPQSSAPRSTTGAPVAVGEVHEVEVTEPDRRQPEVNGVARIENFVVFVPGGKVGDRVRIRIVDVRARSATAEVLEKLASPESGSSSWREF